MNIKQWFRPLPLPLPPLSQPRIPLLSSRYSLFSLLSLPSNRSISSPSSSKIIYWWRNYLLVHPQFEDVSMVRFLYLFLYLSAALVTITVVKLGWCIWVVSMRTLFDLIEDKNFSFLLFFVFFFCFHFSYCLHWRSAVWRPSILVYLWSL